MKNNIRIPISQLTDNPTPHTRGDYANFNNIQFVFPIGLYAMPDILTEEENDRLLDKVHELQGIFGAGNTSDWMSGEFSPDNCFHISDLNDYLEMQILTKRAEECVVDFARAYGSEAEYNCTESWYNVYTSGRYQEFHTHCNSIFSAIYFAKVPKGAPGTTFKRPEATCMLPPKNIVRNTELQMRNIIGPPMERTLIIFRSNIEHAVPPSTFDGERVTIALNFA